MFSCYHIVLAYFMYLFMFCLFLLIEIKELQDRIAKAKESNEDLTEVGKKLVDLHGEMVLLEIYSILNYTGTSSMLYAYKQVSFYCGEDARS